jgi:hypothetical protein
MFEVTENVADTVHVGPACEPKNALSIAASSLVMIGDASVIAAPPSASYPAKRLAYRTVPAGERGPAKHAPGAGPGKCVTGAGTRTASCTAKG